MSVYDTELEHLAAMATRRGWWAHARHRAQELDADETGMFAGIRADVQARIKALGFRPEADEVGEWWLN